MTRECVGWRTPGVDLVACSRFWSLASWWVDSSPACLRSRQGTGEGVGSHEQTNVENIFAIGDVLEGRPELTPVAIQVTASHRSCPRRPVSCRGLQACEVRDG